jgi:hypothetical protein
LQHYLLGLVIALIDVAEKHHSLLFSILTPGWENKTIN